MTGNACHRPVWRDELTELTGYTLEDIVDCGEELWNFYEKMFPSHRVSGTSFFRCCCRYSIFHLAFPSLSLFVDAVVYTVVFVSESLWPLSHLYP